MNTANAQHGDDYVPASTAQPFPRIELRFGHPSRGYDPGEWVTVEYCIEGLNGERPRALERSALWYTEGKGEEDLGVHSFERFATAETIDRVVPEGTFAIQLPTSPLSYEGVIVKIRWCIRLRVYFESGRDHVSEHVFNVGRVPPSILP
ncbi:MAG: hypothetical protein DWH87_04940 [Planctomycetota bacterium]|jgi:hypothetical protein|nr:MAG: hypothetical protein DWH87_04940 [Planctomycetota bacterium]